MAQDVVQGRPPDEQEQQSVMTFFEADIAALRLRHGSGWQDVVRGAMALAQQNPEEITLAVAAEIEERGATTTASRTITAPVGTWRRMDEALDRVAGEWTRLQQEGRAPARARVMRWLVHQYVAGDVPWGVALEELLAQETPA